MRRCNGPCFFNETFKSGSEASPTCSKHGRPIAEHPAAPASHTASLFQDDGAWPKAHPPPTAAGTSLTFIDTAAPDGRWCFGGGHGSLMVRADHFLLWNKFRTAVGNLKGKNKGLLIVGHAGIGKTMALNLLLSWSLHTSPSLPVFF
jgi:hypothetical protein